jgi:probable F420-dependent oxidoreductase
VPFDAAALGLGRIGIWSAELRHGEPGQIADAAAELETLGYGALWVPGEVSPNMLGDLDRLLGATRSVAIASGILNIWVDPSDEVGRWYRGLSPDHAARFLLGLGVSHSLAIGEAYRKPLTAMREYLDRLAGEQVPASRICLAALGPKMVALARDRTVGAHPYLVTPEHTANAREALGPGPLLAPEQGVVLAADPAAARELARPYVRGYGALENYANSWRRLGFTDEDIAACSDRLIDALFACGDIEVVATRVNAHLAAGADHVCLQVITPRTGAPNFDALLPAWRELSALNR